MLELPVFESLGCEVVDFDKGARHALIGGLVVVADVGYCYEVASGAE